MRTVSPREIAPLLDLIREGLSRVLGKPFKLVALKTTSSRVTALYRLDVSTSPEVTLFVAAEVALSRRGGRVIPAGIKLRHHIGVLASTLMLTLLHAARKHTSPLSATLAAALYLEKVLARLPRYHE